MALGHTICVDSACASDRARVTALAAMADLVDGAVGIGAASFETTVSFTNVAKLTIGIVVTLDDENTAATVARAITAAFVAPRAHIRIVDALDEGIALRFRRAVTCEMVILRHADGIRSACAHKATRVLTLAADAGFVISAGGVRAATFIAAVVLADFAQGTLGIDDTFEFTALHLRIAGEAWQTAAEGAVTDGLTFGVWSASR